MCEVVGKTPTEFIFAVLFVAIESSPLMQTLIAGANFGGCSPFACVIRFVVLQSTAS
jgi:hypothetical protein